MSTNLKKLAEAAAEVEAEEASFERELMQSLAQNVATAMFAPGIHSTEQFTTEKFDEFLSAPLYAKPNAMKLEIVDGQIQDAVAAGLIEVDEEAMDMMRQMNKHGVFVVSLTELGKEKAREEVKTELLRRAEEIVEKIEAL